ncbi:RING-type E3 ubiquitin transferase [Ranunculus cassubicifolius]
MEVPPENDVCSVCHDNFNIPCQANCSHWFCSNCILRVWHHGSALQPCKCPICRRLITLIIPSEASIQDLSDPEVIETLQNVERYNRMFGGGGSSLTQRLRDLPFFLGRLFRELMDPQRSLPLVFRARMFFAMILSGIYILSPIDIIPEGILGVVGLLDDILIGLIFFLHIAAIYRTALVSRHGGGT